MGEILLNKMQHKPIDYDKWDLDFYFKPKGFYETADFRGYGNNISHLLNETEKKVWQKLLTKNPDSPDNLPFHFKNEDSPHVEMVTYFALKLVDYYNEQGNEMIELQKDCKQLNRLVAITSAITHDIGWSGCTKEELDSFYLPNWRDHERPLRIKHQNEGVKSTRKILEDICFEKRYLNDIIEINSEHDTREGFLSINNGIPIDGDRLWRYTLPHWWIFMEVRKEDPLKTYTDHVGFISKEGFFYSDFAKNMAKIELDHALDNYYNGMEEKDPRKQLHNRTI